MIFSTHFTAQFRTEIIHKMPINLQKNKVSRSKVDIHRGNLQKRKYENAPKLQYDITYLDVEYM